MRGPLLVVALLTAPLAGCFGLTGEALSIQRPELAKGTLLKYRIEADGTHDTETFVVIPTGDGGYELEAYNVSRSGFNSPYLHLDADLNPSVFNWTRILRWPLEAGGSHGAKVGGAAATVSTEATEVEGPTGPTPAIRVVATEGSRRVAEIVVLEEPTVIQRIDVDTPSGVDQTWVLEDVRTDVPFNQPPRWTIGDWWSYNATTRRSTDDVQLVYNANDTAREGTPQLVLNPVTAESRFAAIPFLRFRASDIAPQSGYLTGLISTFWDWPLNDGKRWSATTTVGSVDSYVATTEIDTRVRLPDGTRTTAYTVELRHASGEDREPFASYQYAPRVGMLTYAWVEEADGSRPIDWELTDWGTGYHGPMEIPHQFQLLGVPTSSGPTEVEESFTVAQRITRLQVKSTIVREEDASENVTITLERPDGTLAVRENGTGWRDRVLIVDRALDAVNGTWRFHADLPRGTSFFAEVNGIWIEDRQVDYR